MASTFRTIFAPCCNCHVRLSCADGALWVPYNSYHTRKYNDHCCDHPTFARTLLNINMSFPCPDTDDGVAELQAHINELWAALILQDF